MKYLFRANLEIDLDYVKQKLMIQQSQNDMTVTPYCQTYKYFDSPQQVTALKF